MPLVGHVGHATVRQSLIWQFQFPQAEVIIFSCSPDSAFQARTIVPS